MSGNQGKALTKIGKCVFASVCMGVCSCKYSTKRAGCIFNQQSERRFFEMRARWPAPTFSHDVIIKFYSEGQRLEARCELR